jgi:F-type H+-transporting ATPase subunit delta
MTQAATNYGQVLYELEIEKQVIDEIEELFHKTPELKKALASPVVTKAEKHRVIDRIFPRKIRNFLKVLSDHQDMSCMEDIIKAYHTYACMQEGILQAELSYVTEPDEARLGQIRQMLCEKYKKKDVEFHLIKDPGLMGGFVLRVGDIETDWSMKGRLKQLEQKLMRR